MLKIAFSNFDSLKALCITKHILLASDMRMSQYLDPRSCSHAKGHNSLVCDLDSGSSYHQHQGFGTHMAMKGMIERIEMEVHTIVAHDPRT